MSDVFIVYLFYFQINKNITIFCCIESAFYRYSRIYQTQGSYRCNRLRCPLARMSGLQCFNMGHNGHGINLYGVSMTPMEH